MSCVVVEVERATLSALQEDDDDDDEEEEQKDNKDVSFFELTSKSRQIVTLCFCFLFCLLRHSPDDDDEGNTQECRAL